MDAPLADTQSISFKARLCKSFLQSLARKEEQQNTVEQLEATHDTGALEAGTEGRARDTEKFEVGQREARDRFWTSRQMAQFNIKCAKIGVDSEGHQSIDARLRDFSGGRGRGGRRRRARGAGRGREGAGS